MDSQDVIEEQGIKLLELLQVLAKRKMLIIKMCSIALIASVAYSLSLPNIYSATAKILPPQKESGGGISALIGQAGGLASLAAGGLGGGGDLYVGILKSRSVNDAVVERLDLVNHFKAENAEAARRSLEGAVKVQAGKDGIISITAEDKSPEMSSVLANTFVEELGKITVRLNLSKAGTERLFLEQRLKLVKKDLKNAEDDLKSYAQQNKIVQVESQAKASIEGIARMKGELASKEVQLSVLRSTRTDESAEVKALATGVQRLKGEISRLSGSNSGGEGIPSVGAVPGVGLEYSRKMRELKTQEAIFEQLSKQYEMAKLTEAKDSSSFQILDSAVIPVHKVKPKRSMIVIYWIVSAFLVSALSAFLLEYLEKMPEEDKELLDSIKRQALSLKKEDS